MSLDLIVEMSEVLEYFLIIYSIGNFLFMIAVVENEDIFGNWRDLIRNNTYSFIGLFFSIMHAFAPM